MKSQEEKEIEKEYNIILEDFKKVLGNDTTFSSDLEKIGYKKLGSRFAGVFPSDKIPRLNQLKKYAIVNLDNSNQPGSHWVAVAYDDKSNDLVVYDSFGRSSKKILPSIHEKYGGSYKILDTDYDAEQKTNEDNCGQRSLAFLSYFNKNGKDKSLKI